MSKALNILKNKSKQLAQSEQTPEIVSLREKLNNVIEKLVRLEAQERVIKRKTKEHKTLMTEVVADLKIIVQEIPDK